MNRVWLMPGVLAVVSSAGLAAAIFGDGVWDGLCWAGLSVPLAVCAHKLWRQWPAR